MKENQHRDNYIWFVNKNEWYATLRNKEKMYIKKHMGRTCEKDKLRTFLCSFFLLKVLGVSSERHHLYHFYSVIEHLLKFN